MERRDFSDFSRCLMVLRLSNARGLEPNSHSLTHKQGLENLNMKEKGNTVITRTQDPPAHNTQLSLGYKIRIHLVEKLRKSYHQTGRTPVFDVSFRQKGASFIWVILGSIFACWLQRVCGRSLWRKRSEDYVRAARLGTRTEPTWRRRSWTKKNAEGEPD